MPSLRSLQQWQPAARPRWGHQRGPCPSRPCLAIPVTPSLSPPHLPLGRVCGKNSAVAAGSSAPWDAPRAARAARPGRAGAGRGDHGAGERTCASAPTQGHPTGPSVGHGWPHATGGGGCPCCPCCPCCPPAARLLVSFTWIPSRSDWKHPGTTLPMRIASVPAGEVSSPKESNWERAQITARNLLVFI